MKQHPALGWSLAAALAALLVLGAHQSSFLRVEESFAGGVGDVAGMSEVREIIRQRWVEEPEEGQLLEGALEGMVSTLDPFSDFIPASELERFEQNTSGKFGGLGIYISVEDGAIVVISPIEDTPAWKAGMLPGDRILAVDGVPCEFASADAAVRALKGAPETTVDLTVQHEGADAPVLITIERAVIQIRSVKGARILDPQSQLGYLRITTFNAGTVKEFRAAVTALNEEGLRGLILDLRGNPGGYLNAAAQVADAFLAEDTVIVKTRGRGEGPFQETHASSFHIVKVPTAILIDRGSASASEILAGALKDQEVASLVGQRSYGKGSVQSIIKILGARAELKLTTQHYFTPSGRRIHRGGLPEEDASWGLIPDHEVPIGRNLRYELSLKESDREMARLKQLATGEGEIPPEFVHLEDPQVRRAYTVLLEQLGDPLPSELAAAPSGDVAPVDTRTQTEGEGE